MSGAAPMRVAIRVGLDIARGLHAAHELSDPEKGLLGVVHQDISPQNVLVAYDGAIKLVDFGVARFAAIEGSRTETLRGKAAYASPEQLSGKNIDRRTDVFALGVVVWELLAGRRLFRKENNAATYVAILQDAVPDLCAVSDRIPEGIADVIACALDRNLDSRYPTADAFARALAAAASESGVGWADDGEIARWVSELVPPQITPEEIEREILVAVAAEASGRHAVRVVPELDLPPPKASAYAPARTSVVPERASHVAVSKRPPELDVAYRRPTFLDRTPADAPPASRRLLAHATAFAIFVAAGGLLSQLVHRRGGIALAAVWPHAFDASSSVQSGGLALGLLAAVVVLGFGGLRLRPRSWAFVAAALPALLASLAMVTITLVATEEEPIPPDGARLVPYVLPLALLFVGGGLAGRAAHLFAEESAAKKAAGVPLAAIGGAIAFFAIETSALMVAP